MATDFKPTRFNTTGEKIFLVETAPPFDRVEFQFMPMGLTKMRVAKYAAFSPVGRNNDLLHYVGGANTLSFTIDFFSDDENREDVIQKCNFLESLAMRDGGFGPAKNVKLIMGKVFKSDIWVVKSVQTKFSNYDPRFDFLPVRATVKIKLMLDPNRNLTVRDVRNKI